jgi:GTP pyrophosphokinase
MPIPGDRIIGVIERGQGLIIHTHDCATPRKSRSSADKLLEVTWDPHINRLFSASLKLVVVDKRGVLAKAAAAIAEAESNIENVHFSHEDEYTILNFTLQVSNRKHLANIMRRLREIPEVIRIGRVKNTPS